MTEFIDESAIDTIQKWFCEYLLEESDPNLLIVSEGTDYEISRTIFIRFLKWLKTKTVAYDVLLKKKKEIEIEEAFKEVIWKWEQILSGNKNDRGITDCMFCQMFRENGCIECPVRLKTGKPNCEDTPYALWQDHHWQDHYFLQVGGLHCICETCRKHAEAELNFLKELQEDWYGKG